MVQDFTKVGIQPKHTEASNPLTETVRAGGIQPQSGLSGLELAAEKLTGAVPMGIEAPTKGLRKAIGGGWELLAVMEYSFGAVVFLIFGVACCYFGAKDKFELEVFSFGVGSLALAALFARWALRAAKNLRSIAKA